MSGAINRMFPPYRSGMGNLDGGGGHIIYVLATRGPQIHLEHTHTHKLVVVAAQVAYFHYSNGLQTY